MLLYDIDMFYVILDEVRVILICRSYNYIEGVNEKRKRGVV